MDTQLTALINTAISIVFITILGIGVNAYVQARKNMPSVIALLPADIQKILQDAAKFGSEFVEQMDAHGELTKYLTGLKSKAQIKMDLAIDYAVQYIEGILAKNGFVIDIDQDALKVLIQKYVWDNPQLFPSGDNKPTES